MLVRYNSLVAKDSKLLLKTNVFKQIKQLWPTLTPRQPFKYASDSEKKAFENVKKMQKTQALETLFQPNADFTNFVNGNTNSLNTVLRAQESLYSMLTRVFFMTSLLSDSIVNSTRDEKMIAQLKDIFSQSLKQSKSSYCINTKVTSTDNVDNFNRQLLSKPEVTANMVNIIDLVCTEPVIKFFANLILAKFAEKNVYQTNLDKTYSIDINEKTKRVSLILMADLKTGVGTGAVNTGIVYSNKDLKKETISWGTFEGNVIIDLSNLSYTYKLSLTKAENLKEFAKKAISETSTFIKQNPKATTAGLSATALLGSGALLLMGVLGGKKKSKSQKRNRKTSCKGRKTKKTRKTRKTRKKKYIV